MDCVFGELSELQEAQNNKDIINNSDNVFFIINNSSPLAIDILLNITTYLHAFIYVNTANISAPYLVIIT